MFFDLDLLCRQSKGKFAIIWIAATRGISHIKKNEIENVNIINVCNEILKFVMSDSTQPRRRLSLYLSAKLTYGAVLIHRQQVITLEKNAVFFFASIKRPVYRCVPAGVDLTDKRKKQKKTGKKRPEDAYLTEPEQMRQPLPIESSNVINIELITLPEATSTRLQINEPDFFGDEGQIDQQLALFENIYMPNFHIPEPEPQPIPPVRESAAGADKRLIDTVEDVEQSPSKRRKSERRPVTPIVRQVQHGFLSPNEEERALMPPPPPSRRLSFPKRPCTDSVTELTDDQMLQNITAPPPQPTRTSAETDPRPRRNPRYVKRYLSQEFALFHFSRWQGHEIYKSLEIVDKRRKRTSQNISPDSPDHSRQYDNASAIIEEILGEVRGVDDIIPEVRHVEEDTSLEAENRLRRTPDRHSKTLDAPAQNITAPVEVSNVINVLSPLQMVPSPRFSKIPTELEIDSFRIPQPEPVQIPEEIGPEFQTPVRVPVRPTEETRPSPRIHTSTPIVTESIRHSTLLKFLRDHFNETSGQPLTIPEICEPLTRFNVAVAFNALLHLHAQRYIILTTSDDSLELNRILPGPRI